MKMIHKNLGEVELAGELGKAEGGRTMVKLKDGQTIIATTAYLKPLPANPPTPKADGTV